MSSPSSSFPSSALLVAFAGCTEDKGIGGDRPYQGLGQREEEYFRKDLSKRIVGQSQYKLSHNDGDRSDIFFLKNTYAKNFDPLLDLRVVLFQALVPREESEERPFNGVQNPLSHLFFKFIDLFFGDSLDV